jgi:hypothetical protein
MVSFASFCFENDRSSPIFLQLFSAAKFMNILRQKKGSGYILGGTFHKLIWSPCSLSIHRFLCFVFLFVTFWTTDRRSAHHLGASSFSFHTSHLNDFATRTPRIISL